MKTKYIDEQLDALPYRELARVYVQETGGNPFGKSVHQIREELKESPATRAFKAKQRAKATNTPKGTAHGRKAKRAQKQQRRKENEAARRKERAAIEPPKIPLDAGVRGKHVGLFDRIEQVLFPRSYAAKQREQQRKRAEEEKNEEKAHGEDE